MGLTESPEVKQHLQHLLRASLRKSTLPHKAAAALPAQMLAQQLSSSSRLAGTGLACRHKICPRQVHCVRAASDRQAESSSQDTDDSTTGSVQAPQRRSRTRNRTAVKSKAKRKSSKAGPPSGGKVQWPEGQLLPTGWEKMSPPQKAYQLWAGQRGALFWANKAAYASVFIVVGGWVLFRFVGPALGLYKLANDITTPNL